MTDITQYSAGGAVVAPTGDESPESLVALAIREKVPVEVLERLVALQERVTDRNARAAYFEALAAFQEECPPITKTANAKIVTKGGGSYGYTYAPLEEIVRTIRPILKRHGLSFSFDVEPGNGVLTVVCVLRHIEGHSERASFPVPVDTAAAMSGAQKNGAALTYGKRQSLTAVLGLVTADEDSDAAERETRRRGGDEKVTREQLAELERIAGEVKADVGKFCEWLGIPALADLPKSGYQSAVNALEEKRRRA